MKILVCTDGSEASIESAELLIKLAYPKETRVTVLGVSENIDHVETIIKAMDQINNSLGASYTLDRKIRNGDPIEEIMSEAVEVVYDLVVVGGGRSQLNLLNPRLGSTTSKLARKLHSHFLVARNIPPKISKILVCAGTSTHVGQTMTLGGSWISNVSAQVTLLHVLPIGEKEGTNGELVVKKARQQLEENGVRDEINVLIKRGLVVEEVLNEVTEGKYELLVVGAHYQPGHDRWQSTLLDDVTDQLLNKSTCSVLII